MKLAILLSCDSFESYYSTVLGLSPEEYLKSYRNDWSWYYAFGIRDANIDTIIYIPSLYRSGIYNVEEGISVRFIKIDKWYRPISVIRRAFRINKLFLYIHERVNTISFLKSMARSLKEDAVDLLYIQEHWTGRFDQVVSKIEMPIVSGDHGGVADKTLKLFKKKRFLKVKRSYAQTEVEANIINKYGGSALLHPNGCDTEKFYPDKSVTRTKSLLTVARLTDKQKRTSDLIRAMEFLSSDWTLDIVGTGPDKEKLEKIVLDLKLSHRVKFHGFVDRSEVRKFLQRCGVYAMPSENEGIPIALLEAMGCGAAVVVSQIRAFESVIENNSNGMIFPVGDIQLLSKSIEYAWENKLRLGKKAYTTVSTDYNTKKLYSDLAKSLKECL